MRTCRSSTDNLHKTFIFMEDLSLNIISNSEHNNVEIHGGEELNLDKTALILIIIGGLNWGLMGLFGFDAVAWFLGGSGSVLSRLVYIVIALAACWSISLLFRRNAIAEEM